MVDARQAAALAELGARTVALGVPDLEVFVHHSGSDRPATSLDLELAVAPIGDPDEIIGFVSSGVAAEVCTRFASPSGTSLPFHFTEIDARQLSSEIHDAPDQRVGAAFGMARSHSPSFLYDARHSLEVLLTLDPGRAPSTLSDSIALAEVIEAMCQAAADIARAPILFLQAPVAPHNDPTGRYRTDGSGEHPRVGQSFAVRMAVGLEDTQSTERISMLRHLEQFCNARGVGMQISDPRLGRVRGEWWSVCSPNVRLFQEKRDALCLEVIGRSVVSDSVRCGAEVGEVHLLTAIGPARTGSSLAIIADLFRRNIGVLAASVGALQEMAVINLVIPVSPALEGATFSTAALPLSNAISEVARLAALTPQSGSRRTRAEYSKAADYVLVRSGPFRFLDDGEAVASYAVWVSWEVAGRETPKGPALVAARHFRHDPVVLDCKVMYVRSRWVSSAERTRGRAKLAVWLREPMAAASVASWLSLACERAEDAIEREVAAGAAEGFSAVRVGWRERWLGGWPVATPL